MHKKLERDAQQQRLDEHAEKMLGRRRKERMDKEDFSKYIEQIREKKQLHAIDLEQNRARMKLMNKIRAFSVFEKHTKKNNYLKHLKEVKAGAIPNTGFV
jgi:hypothetical protein